VEVRSRRRSDEGIRHRDVPRQRADDLLAEIDAHGLIEFSGAQSTVFIRGRELDLHVRRNLRQERLFVEPHIRAPHQHVAEAALRRGGGGFRKFAFGLLPRRHSAARDDHVLLVP